MFTNSLDTTRFFTQLKKHEGERLVAYLDTLGILTIGVGHNCVTSPVSGVIKVGDRITKELSDKLFKEDVEVHNENLLRVLPWVRRLDAPRLAVLLNMNFNMGTSGLLKFKNTLKLIERGFYSQAAKEMLKSKWARQVGYRAKELSQQMEIGEWVDIIGR